MAGLGSGLQKQDWDMAKMPKFEKNFYREHPVVAARSDTEIETFRRKHEMKVFGRGVPKPVTTFDEASFPCMFDCVLVL